MSAAQLVLVSALTTQPCSAYCITNRNIQDCMQTVWQWGWWHTTRRLSLVWLKNMSEAVRAETLEKWICDWKLLIWVSRLIGKKCGRRDLKTNALTSLKSHLLALMKELHHQLLQWSCLRLKSRGLWLDQAPQWGSMQLCSMYAKQQSVFMSRQILQVKLNNCITSSKPLLSCDSLVAEC